MELSNFFEVGGSIFSLKNAAAYEAVFGTPKTTKAEGVLSSVSWHWKCGTLTIWQDQQRVYVLDLTRQNYLSLSIIMVFQMVHQAVDQVRPAWTV